MSRRRPAVYDGNFVGLGDHDPSLVLGRRWIAVDRITMHFLFWWIISHNPTSQFEVRIMDRLRTAMRAFHPHRGKRRSFTRARRCSVCRDASVTDAVKGLEARLGVRLLQRTTRQSPNPGRRGPYYQRCVNLIADMNTPRAPSCGAKPQGSSVSMLTAPGRYFLLPGLPAFGSNIPISGCT